MNIGALWLFQALAGSFGVGLFIGGFDNYKGEWSTGIGAFIVIADALIAIGRCIA